MVRPVVHRNMGMLAPSLDPPCLYSPLATAGFYALDGGLVILRVYLESEIVPAGFLARYGGGSRSHIGIEDGLTGERGVLDEIPDYVQRLDRGMVPLCLVGCVKRCHVPFALRFVGSV